MKTKRTKMNRVTKLLTLTGIVMLLSISLSQGVAAKNENGKMIDVYMPPYRVVECASELESKIVAESLFLKSNNLNEVRQKFLQGNDFLEHPSSNRLYEAVLSDLGSILGRDEYPRARIHQVLQKKFGSNVIPIVTRCILAMNLYREISPGTGKNLFRQSDNSARFYPLKKDILDVLNFLQIPLSHSVEGITEFSLEYPVLDMTENGDILLVGKKNGEKVSLARISRQQVLDDWAKIHDAFFTLCKQPLSILNQPLDRMPGTKRVNQ